MFEVARGTMLYGYYFYPLFTVGVEQMFRICQVSVSKKCRIERMESGQKTLDFLLDNNFITIEDYGVWDSLRKLRNITSHPEKQTILTPSVVLSFATHLPSVIEKLFE